MPFQPHSQHYSIDEYFELEERSDIRHEYHNGDLVAMLGVRVHHSLISGNLQCSIYHHLRNGSCLVHGPGMKVKIQYLQGNEQAEHLVYPDISVTCDKRDQHNEVFIRYPKLIVEVLSPSTVNYDRGDKFRLYRLIPTLQDYLLVDQREKNVECFHREDLTSQRWELQTYTEGNVSIPSLELEVPMEQIYHKVTF